MLVLQPQVTTPHYAQPPLTFRTNLWFSPADGARLGGDWCDAYALSETRLAVAIFDVAGHGENAAAAMQAMRNVFFVAMRSGVCPSAVLSLANAVAFAREEGLIVTALVGILDGARREFTFASAGHPAPLLIAAGRQTFLSKPIGDLPLGLFAKLDVALQTAALPPDAMLVVYTDGLTEHTRDIDCGERDLVKSACAMYRLPMLHAAKTIAHGVLASGRGDDDVAVIAVRTRRPAKA